MNQLIGINDWYLVHDVSAGISFQRLVAPRFGLPVDEAKVQSCLPRAEVCIGEVARLLGDQPFMAGETLSIADLMLAPHLAFFAEAAEGKAILAGHPALAAWIARMRERPSMANTTWDRLERAAQGSARRFAQNLSPRALHSSRIAEAPGGGGPGLPARHGFRPTVAAGRRSGRL